MKGQSEPASVWCPENALGCLPLLQVAIFADYFASGENAILGFDLALTPGFGLNRPIHGAVRTATCQNKRRQADRRVKHRRNE
jgi:hypothetical protein